MGTMDYLKDTKLSTSLKDKLGIILDRLAKLDGLSYTYSIDILTTRQILILFLRYCALQNIYLIAGNPSSNFSYIKFHIYINGNYDNYADLLENAITYIINRILL